VSRRLFVPPFAELGGLVVRDSHRRRGVASGLLLRAEGWAAEIGCHVFRIRTNTQRIESAPFYRHRGYVLSKTQYVFEKILTLDQHT
jgi:GNAT superfamily N-acetyltransferase